MYKVDVLLMQQNIDLALQKIEKQFTDDCKITLIVRKPDNNEIDIVFTRDNLDEVINVIKRTKIREINKHK